MHNLCAFYSIMCLIISVVKPLLTGIIIFISPPIILMQFPYICTYLYNISNVTCLHFCRIARATNYYAIPGLRDNPGSSSSKRTVSSTTVSMLMCMRELLSDFVCREGSSK